MYLFESSEAKYTLYTKKFWLDILVKAYTQDDEMSTWFTRIQSRVGLSTPFQPPEKKQQKKYFMQMYTGTRLTTVIFRRLSPRFFTERRGASVHRLIFGCHWPLLQNYSYLANINMAFHCGKAQSGPCLYLKIKQRINLLIVGHLTKAITKTHYYCYYYILYPNLRYSQLECYVAYCRKPLY